jgi:hypothetical protein
MERIKTKMLSLHPKPPPPTLITGLEEKSKKLKIPKKSKKYLR